MSQTKTAQDTEPAKPHKKWLVQAILLLFGAGSFALWFFLTTLLIWALVTALRIHSPQAFPAQAARDIIDVLRYSVPLFGNWRPTPAVPAHAINLVLFCFNTVIGWYWIKRDRCGRFALLLVGEFFIITCALYALALHIASSPLTRNSNILGF